MNKDILSIAIQEFIKNNLSADINILLLKKEVFNSVSIKEVVEQIEAKNKCKKKLPTWFNTKDIYYPNKLNIEQTSSEVTALYKAQLVSGKSLIDLTGGFGVDSYYFSKTVDSVIHCELDPKLSEIATHNFEVLKANNINTIASNGITHLSSEKVVYDWIYIDPSRRHDSKGKVFYLSDCLPNVPEHIDLLFEHSNNILIKTSPMLDVTLGIKELKFVKEVHTVALNNDVKELLFVLEKGYSKAIKLIAINLKASRNETFEFYSEDEKDANIKYGDIKSHLYEPNAAILKLGAFKSVAVQYNLEKLHQHTHLYTHDDYIDFPGRVFKVKEVLTYQKKELLKRLKGQKANVSIRNFPETVSQLKKKFGFKDGGQTFIFFTTDKDNKKIVVFCEKV